MKIKWEWAMVTVFLGVITLIYTMLPGNVEPLTPSSFAIVQGIGNFQSDHIIIPIEWMNYGGQQALIRPTQLTLTNENETLIFALAGEFVGASSNELGHIGEYYSLKQAFVAAPHAITPTTMVFHVKDWWTEDNRTRGKAFTFKNNTTGDYYDILLYYSSVSGRMSSSKNMPLFKLKIRNWTRSLNYKDYRWDASSTDLIIQNRSWWQFWK